MYRKNYSLYTIDDKDPSLTDFSIPDKKGKISLYLKGVELKEGRTGLDNVLYPDTIKRTDPIYYPM